MGFFVSKKGRIWYRNGPVPGCLSAMLVGVVEPFSGNREGFLYPRRPALDCEAFLSDLADDPFGVPGFWRLAREGE